MDGAAAAAFRPGARPCRACRGSCPTPQWSSVVYSIGEKLPSGRVGWAGVVSFATGSALRISKTAQSWLENIREAAMFEPQQPTGRAPSAPALRLVCLPHAGGSSLPFAGWQTWMPAGVLVLMAALPG